MVSFDLTHFSFDSSEITGLAQRSFASFQTGFHHRLFLGDLFLQWWLAFGHLFFQWWLAIWQFDLQQILQKTKHKQKSWHLCNPWSCSISWTCSGWRSFVMVCQILCCYIYIYIHVAILFTGSYYEKTLTLHEMSMMSMQISSAKPSIHLVHWFAAAIIHKFFSFSKAILNFVFYSYHLFFHSHQSTQLLFHSTEAQHLLVDSEPFAHLSQLLLHTRQLLYQLHRHSGHGGHGHRSHGGHGRHRCWHGCCGRRWWDQSGEQALARRRDGNTERRGRWNRIKKQDDTTVTRIPFQKEPAPNSERPNKSQNKATFLA